MPTRSHARPQPAEPGMENNLDWKLSADWQTAKLAGICDRLALLRCEDRFQTVLPFCVVRTAFNQSAAKKMPSDRPIWRNS